MNFFFSFVARLKNLAIKEMLTNKLNNKITTLNIPRQRQFEEWVKLSSN